MDIGRLQALQARDEEAEEGTAVDLGADSGADARRGHDLALGGTVILAKLQQPLL